MNLVTGISVESGTILAAVVIIVLSASGGLLTVAYTDAISAIFIFLSLLLAVPILLYETGGMSGLMTQLPVEKLSLWGGYKPLDTIGYVIAMLFLTLGDQNMFSRFGAAVNEKVAKISALGFIVGSILLSCLNVFVATVAIPYLPGIKPDTAFLMVAMNMLPFVVGGCVLAAAIAFMITTGDSFLLSSATSIYNDIIKKHSRRTFTEMQIFFIMRGLIVLLGVFSYLLITKFSDILGMMMYAYTIYGAAITPALIAALCWKKVTPAGGLSSILTGGIVTLAWELGLKSHFGEIDSALVAIPLSILVLIGVSLFTRKSCEGVSCESAS